MKARLHHHAGSYSVLFDGKLLVEGSRDPECDAARALLALGYTGTLHMLDGKTGIPRTIIDIERAAKVTTKEGRHGPYFAKLKHQIERTASKAMRLVSQYRRPPDEPSHNAPPSRISQAAA
jgi:hypothetical protein